MRVFVSSVRRGLEEERDALKAHILALGHVPVFFEDFTAQSVPSREACLKAVETADICILLLGPYYGKLFPETGTSPTHDEHTVALRRGIPRIVMHKLGVDFETEQEKFANQIENYTTGLFRGEFKTAAELLTEVTKTLAEIAAAPKSLVWRPLSQSIAHLPVKLDDSPTSRSAVMLHCIPVTDTRLSSMQLRDSTGQMTHAIRDCQIVSQAESLDSSSDSNTASVKAVESRIHRTSGFGLQQVTLATFGGVQLNRGCQFDAWSFLACDSLGALVDEASLTEDLTRLVGLIALLDLPFGDEVALGASIAIGFMINEGNPADLGKRNGASASIFQHRGSHVTTDIDDMVPSSSVAAGAMEIGRELALRLLQKFRELR